MTQADAQHLVMTIHGARGSIPVPGPRTVRYGGNTSCIEFAIGNFRVLVDCGSGARKLGAQFAAEGVRSVALLFTHTHHDHVVGFPFFMSSLAPSIELSCYAGHLKSPKTIGEVLRKLTAEVFWPLGPDRVRQLARIMFKPGETLRFDSGVSAETVRLCHPGGATGYIIGWGGRRIAIITDHEHGDREIDAGIAAAVHGVDLLIVDTTYTDAEYPQYRGWGHATVEWAARLARDCEVGELMLFHHSPDRSDDELDAVVRSARSIFERTHGAIEDDTRTYGVVDHDQPAD